MSIINNYEPPRAYAEWVDQRIDDLAARLANDDFLNDNFSHWIPRYQYQSQKQAAEQYKLRHAALQYIADQVLAEFGYDRIPVFLSVNGTDIDPTADPERMKQTLGMFTFVPGITGGEFILINYFDHSMEMLASSTLSNPQKALKTILEEAKHATDLFTVHDLFSGKIGRDDPRYAHGLALFVNQSGRYSDVRVINLPLLGKIQLGFSDYEDQYVERKAKEFAKAMVRSMKEKQKPKARPRTPFVPGPMS